MELSEKVKELVAVGASITANCQPCLQYHAEKAQANGADAGEVKAAIEVGKQVRKGASAKMDQFSSSMKETQPVPADEKKSACCGGVS
jgi:AhpD family alkylhydroperoxidase